MGLDYSVELYFPTERIEAALAWTARFAARDKNASTTVTLPSRKVISVPFTSGFKSAAIALRHQDQAYPACLDTCLLFPMDEAIRASYGHCRTEILDGVEYGAIGYIYLYIKVGCLFAKFDYQAATSPMSRLLVDSTSVRGRFATLLREVGGVAGIIDVEEIYRFRSLDEPSQWVIPTWGSDIDGFTETLCHELGRPFAPELGAAVSAGTNGTVIRIAQGIRERRRVTDLPILADAMEEAGVTRQDILRHCREAGEHAGECAVVKRLLGRR